MNRGEGWGRADEQVARLSHTLIAAEREHLRRHRSILGGCGCALTLLLSATGASAQTCTPAWGEMYAPPGMNSPVNAVVVADVAGRPILFAAGRFTQAGTVAASKVARWDGNHWSPLGIGLGGIAPTGNALAAAPQEWGGGLFLGGDFTNAGGITAQNVAHWSGTAWSALGSGVNQVVFSLAVFDDGSGPALFAGGAFTMAGGAEANRIARWDGAVWSPLGTGMNGRVLALAVHDDGSGQALYAAGDFTTAGGVSALRIARWNGQSWSAVGAGFNNPVFALAVFDDGLGTRPSLYSGGNFTTANSVGVSRIARWDGASWHALGIGVGNTVRALAVFDDGTLTGTALYVGGSFTTAGGQPAQRIARWDGTAWSALAPQGLGDAVFALAGTDDFSRIGPAMYVGGSFTTAGGAASAYVARWSGCADVPGDFDANKRLDLSDYAAFASCLAGPAVAVDEPCFVADADSDERVDLFDFAIFSALFTGP